MVESNYWDLSVTSYTVFLISIYSIIFGLLCFYSYKIYLRPCCEDQCVNRSKSMTVIDFKEKVVGCKRQVIKNVKKLEVRKDSYFKKGVGVRNYTTGPGNEKGNWLKEWPVVVVDILTTITVGFGFGIVVKQGGRSVGKWIGGVKGVNQVFNTQMDIVTLSFKTGRSLLQEKGMSILKLQEVGNIWAGLASFGFSSVIGAGLGNVVPVEPLVDVARSSILDMTPQRMYDSIFNWWRLPLFLGAAHDSIMGLIRLSLRRFGFGEGNLSSYQVSLFRWSVFEENSQALFTRRVRLLTPVLGITGLVVGWFLGASGVISPEVLGSMWENFGENMVEEGNGDKEVVEKNRSGRAGLSRGESSDQGAAREMFERMYEHRERDFESIREEWLQKSSESNSPENNQQQDPEEGDEANRSNENGVDKKGKGKAP